MKKLIPKTLIFTIIIIIILKTTADFVFSSQVNKYEHVSLFNSFKNESIDILFMGNSHARNTFNTNIINEVFNCTSYNIGTGGQNLIITNLLLEEFLSQNNTRLVVVELSPRTVKIPNSKRSKGNQLRVIDNVNFSLNKLKAINKVYDFEELPSVLSPTIRNHSDWYGADWNLDKKTNRNSENPVLNDGFMGVDRNMSEDDNIRFQNFKNKYSYYLEEKVEDSEILKLDINYHEISNTIRICAKYQTNLLFVSSPYFDSFYSKNNNRIHYGITNFLTNIKKQDYLDFNLLFNSLDLKANNFYDHSHLNISGANIVTSYLSYYIDKKGYLKIINKTKLNNFSTFEERSYYSLDKVRNRNKIDIIERIQNKIKVSEHPKAHIFTDGLESKNIILFSNNSYKYVGIQLKQSFNEKIFDIYEFGIHLLFKEEDFDKRPKWMIGTDKDRITYSLKPEIIKINDLKYAVLKLKKSNLESFKQIRIFIKNQGEFKGVVGKSLEIKNINFVN